MNDNQRRARLNGSRPLLHLSVVSARASRLLAFPLRCKLAPVSREIINPPALFNLSLIGYGNVCALAARAVATGDKMIGKDENPCAK